MNGCFFILVKNLATWEETIYIRLEEVWIVWISMEEADFRPKPHQKLLVKISSVQIHFWTGSHLNSTILVACV